MNYFTLTITILILSILSAPGYAEEPRDTKVLARHMKVTALSAANVDDHDGDGIIVRLQQEAIVTDTLFRVLVAIRAQATQSREKTLAALSFAIGMVHRECSRAAGRSLHAFVSCGVAKNALKALHRSGDMWHTFLTPGMMTEKVLDPVLKKIMRLYWSF